jgi:hypothetical protein
MTHAYLIERGKGLAQNVQIRLPGQPLVRSLNCKSVEIRVIS